MDTASRYDSYWRDRDEGRTRARSRSRAFLALRLLARLRPWSMLEVFLVGILVALVKLGDMAEIVPGLAIWSLAVLIVVLAWITVALDERAVWHRVPVANS